MSFDHEKNHAKIHRKQGLQVFFGILMILSFTGILLTLIATALTPITEVMAIILIAVFLILGLIFAAITLGIGDNIMKDIDTGHSKTMNMLHETLINLSK